MEAPDVVQLAHGMKPLILRDGSVRFGSFVGRIVAARNSGRNSGIPLLGA